MKNIELFNLQAAIITCGPLAGAKFAYALAKNSNILRREIESLECAIKPTDEYQVYDTKRIEIAKKNSNKHADGQPVTISTGQNSFNYDIQDQSAFDAEIKKLKEEYKEVVDKREIQTADYLKLLNDKAVELCFHKIDIADVPADITVSQLSGISVLFEDRTCQKT